ncbi:MAG: response regulator transcription factor [Calothrix sp. SM1_5_4]|nr:response regulator transcription factor [Calothrix sp. SM1_5_4]
MENSSPSPRVLIVEDEIKLLENLRRLLGAEGFVVEACSTVGDFQKALEEPSNDIDVIVLDRLLQGYDSADLLPRIKGRLPEAKLMILSAINTAAEKASLLDSGADDYLAKPYHAGELVARVRALLRRSAPRLGIANVSLDLENRTMTVEGVEIPLTNKEFTLLKTLVRTPGKVFSKAFLYREVWGVSCDIESNVIEATVNKLRRRLKECGAGVEIRNMRNAGYWVEE